MAQIILTETIDTAIVARDRNHTTCSGDHCDGTERSLAHQKVTCMVKLMEPPPRETTSPKAREPYSEMEDTPSAS